jgi:ABC-type spermidine/putrescine transport system permease subunit I
VGFLTTSQTGLFDTVPTLANYRRVLTDGYYLGVLWTTLRISLEVTAWCLVFGYPTAYWLATASRRTRKIILLLLMFPLLLSTVIRIYSWIVLLGRRGLVNQILLDTGLITRPIGLLYQEWTVILGMISILIPFAIINMTNTLVSLDPAVREAAAIHGASGWQVFLKVTLPMSRPGILSACLIVFSVSMSTYLISLLLGGPRIKLLGNLVFDATSSFNWPLGAAVSVVLVLLTLGGSSAFSAILSTDRQRNAG